MEKFHRLMYSAVMGGAGVVYLRRHGEEMTFILDLELCMRKCGEGILGGRKVNSLSKGTGRSIVGGNRGLG